ncbi:transposase [Microvirga sp. VF16]|uniref:transposase n=1 Tax=Microvirga sp. VF16 TaxID=2807101 RepID=UPI00193DA86C|nr:transposase [Microvirga sp. VF16]QRM33488.1 transposase [Microvirga sp. VF16]QRM33645.1 transposase [Microvirga sp. VF16]
MQRPATKAKERDELVIAVWPKREWVALKRRHSGSAARCSSGTRPATASGPRPDTTWARRGLPPLLRRVSKRREVSSIVAITPDGRLYARHFRTSVSSQTVISALLYFRRKIGTPLLVVWDRLNAHRSQVTTAFIAAHARDFAVAYLPAYAPELNPEEQCNACVKRAMENALPESVADLHRLARREFVRLQRQPEMIVSFFRHAGLSVT